MDALARAGISIDELATRLVKQGVEKFASAYEDLLLSLGKKRDRVLGAALQRTSYTLPPLLDTQPNHGYSFGVVKAAEARADFNVLIERGRRMLRVHLGTNVGAGLATLRAAIERSLSLS